MNISALPDDRQTTRFITISCKKCGALISRQSFLKNLTEKKKYAREQNGKMIRKPKKVEQKICLGEMPVYGVRAPSSHRLRNPFETRN